ncbi:MAG: metallophosphoesterase [Candidatus Nitrosotenuis sp.]
MNNIKISYFRLASDIHLEFKNFTVPALPTDCETLLILAGDIHVGALAVSFVRELASRFAAVFYVFGNHEFYHNQIVRLVDKVKDELADLPNVVVTSDGDVAIFDGVTVIGATLWADANKNDPITKYHLLQRMNDFYVIKNTTRTFTPDDMVKLHSEQLSFIENRLSYHQGCAQPIIVVTHHLPSSFSTPPQYRADFHMNGGYRTELNDIIDKFKPTYWLHGHTHDSCSYEMGNTKVICNPRGYNDENPLFDAELLLEL